MSVFPALIRETRFTAREPSVWLWWVIVLCLSTVSVSFGLKEVKQQNATIEKLIDANQQENLNTRKKLKSWGSAAYYNFHLAYDRPSNFAFAAMGQRDAQPWKHRIRMLALEGQIYESDVGNPSIALIGRFDFAFFVAFIIPLVLIMLLYDLKSSEKTAGRHHLLESTVGQPFSFWLLRAVIRATGLFLCLIIPLIIAACIAGTSFSTLALACLAILVYTAFWTLVCVKLALWGKPNAKILMTLLSIWVFSAVLIPAAARIVIDKLVPVPTGAEILMLQRESVNDAWDLPREVTMDAFFERHPEWSAYQPVESSFEWQWYYAFQQVGDQKTETLSKAYRDGRLQRANIAAWVSLLSPPSLLERWLQALAKTDLNASITYEQSVRDYHGQLRAYYYPRFFSNQAFDKALLDQLPTFKH